MIISGISWPAASIPDNRYSISKIFPSTYGIEGYVKINSLGATFGEVKQEFNSLWILTVFYFLLAYLLYYREISILKLRSLKIR